MIRKYLFVRYSFTIQTFVQGDELGKISTAVLSLVLLIMRNGKHFNGS